MDDNEFRGRPDGNGSGARPSWTERVNLPDHLRPPLPGRRPADEPSTSEEEEFALPVAEPEADAPETAPVDGILPDSEGDEEHPVDSTVPRTTPPDTVPVPEPDGAFDLDDPALYLNRELTWLNFNYRIL